MISPPPESHNATYYYIKTYRFLKLSFRKQIDKKAPRRSWGPLGRPARKTPQEGEGEEGDASEKKRKGLEQMPGKGGRNLGPPPRSTPTNAC